MGYLRYQPWFVLAEYLAFAKGVAWLGKQWPRITRWSVGLLGGLWTARLIIATGTSLCSNIDQAFALQAYFLQSAPRAMYSCIWREELAQSYGTGTWSPEALAVFGHPGEVAVLNFWFLRREIEPLAQSRIVIIDPPSAEVRYPPFFPGFSCAWPMPHPLKTSRSSQRINGSQIAPSGYATIPALPRAFSCNGCRTCWSPA